MSGGSIPATGPAAEGLGFPAVQLLAFAVLGVVAMVTAYALGQPGPVCAILFGFFLFVGGLLRVIRPITDWMTRPS